MKITVITPGMGREKMPEGKCLGSQVNCLANNVCYCEKWEEAHPWQIALDQQGNKLPPGECDVELVDRLETVAGWETISLKQYNERDEVNRLQSSPVYSMQQVYQSSTPQPNKGETVEEAALKAYPVPVAHANALMKPLRVSERNAFIAGHNWKQSQGLVSVEAVLKILDEQIQENLSHQLEYTVTVLSEIKSKIINRTN